VGASSEPPRDKPACMRVGRLAAAAAMSSLAARSATGFAFRATTTTTRPWGGASWAGRRVASRSSSSSSSAAGERIYVPAAGYQTPTTPAARSTSANRFELEGVLSRVGEVQAFQSGRYKREVLVRITENGFENKVMLNFWGDMADTVATYRPEDSVVIGFNIRSNEYNGKYYTNLNAWRIRAVASRAMMDPPMGAPRVRSDVVGASSAAAAAAAAATAVSKIPEYQSDGFAGGDDDVDDDDGFHDDTTAGAAPSTSTASDFDADADPPPSQELPF